MSELKNAEKRLNHLDQDIDNLLDMRSKLRQEVADLVCPFKVGNKIIDMKKNKGGITGIYWNYDNSYKLFIKKVKKDGGLFVNDCRVYNCDSWELYQDD